MAFIALKPFRFFRELSPAFNFVAQAPCLSKLTFNPTVIDGASTATRLLVRVVFKRVTFHLCARKMVVSFDPRDSDFRPVAGVLGISYFSYRLLLLWALDEPILNLIYPTETSANLFGQ